MAITSRLTTERPVQELTFQVAPRCGKEGGEVQIPLDGPCLEGNTGLAIPFIEPAAAAHDLVGEQRRRLVEQDHIHVGPAATARGGGATALVGPSACPREIIDQAEAMIQPLSGTTGVIAWPGASVLLGYFQTEDWIGHARALEAQGREQLGSSFRIQQIGRVEEGLGAAMVLTDTEMGLQAVRDVIRPRVAVNISTTPTLQDLLKQLLHQLFPVIPPDVEFEIRLDQQSQTVFIFV